MQLTIVIRSEVTDNATAQALYKSITDQLRGFTNLNFSAQLNETLEKPTKPE